MLSMTIIHSPVLQMTAVTDLIISLEVILILAQLRQFQNYKVTIWRWTFGLLAAASFLGALAHGLDISARTYLWLWQPVNLMLGLVIGLFVVATVYDLFTESVARKTLPFMIAVALLFYGITVVIPGTFLTFIIYEAVALLFALGGYIWLANKKTLAGAMSMAVGILVMIIAAVVQTQGQDGDAIFWRFDHNSVFHLIQLFGLFMLLIGLTRALDQHQSGAMTTPPPH